jgi:hypothetical protein
MRVRQMYIFQAQKVAAFGFAIAICVASSGCGDGRPSRVPVSGQVLIDGKPLTRGTITFVPPEGRASSGKLDESGHFTLSCFETGDGAVIGTHKISITSAEGINEAKTRWFAPKKLADHRTSGLSQQVTGPLEDLKINISWEGGREFVEEFVGVEGEDFRGGRNKQK